MHLDLTHFVHGVINSCVGFKPHKHVGCKGVSIGEVRNIFWASPKSNLSQKKCPTDTLVSFGGGCGGWDGGHFFDICIRLCLSRFA